MVLGSLKKNQKLGLILLAFFCAGSQLLPVIRSGIKYSYGIGFWGPNGHDGIWHLALINSIHNPLVINNPAISGNLLQNYHPFYDILISWLSRITVTSASIWLFQLMPIVLVFLTIVLSYQVGLKLFKNKAAACYLVFLNFLAGSFGWIITLFKNGNFYGESLFWSMQSISTQLNPPYALSLVILLLLLLLLTDPKTPKNSFKGILLFVFTIILPVTKAYAGVAWYIIFFIYSVIKFSQHQKKLFIIFLFSLPFSYLIFSRYNSSSTGLFELNPFWFVHSMIQSTDRLYLPKVSSFIYNQWLAGEVLTPKYLLVDLACLIIFIIGNFSWRILGFLHLKFHLKDPALVSLLVSILVTFFIPLFLVQKGTPWNTIQFFYYSLFFSNIFLASFLAKSNKIIVLIIIGLTLVSNIGTYQNYLGNPPPTAISNQELSALNFLKTQPPGNVLTYPYDQHSKDLYSSTPVPTYAYETTAYVSAYSHHPTYLADEMNLNISGYDWMSRRNDSIKFFQQRDIYSDRGFLVNNKIDYIYLTGPQRQKVNLSSTILSIAPIYQNNEILIYKVNR